MGKYGKKWEKLPATERKEIQKRALELIETNPMFVRYTAYQIAIRKQNKQSNGIQNEQSVRG